MAPRKEKRENLSDPQGMFSGMIVYLVENGVQSRRLQIWKQRLIQMGARVEDRLSKRVTHILAMNSDSLTHQVGHEHLMHFKGKVLPYQWLEDSLKLGAKEPEDLYQLAIGLGENESVQSLEISHSESAGGNYSDSTESSLHKKARTFDDLEVTLPGKGDEGKETSEIGSDNLAMREHQSTEMNIRDESPTTGSHQNSDADDSSTSPQDAVPKESSLYSAPNLNRNITEIFGKLISIYGAWVFYVQKL